MRTRQLSTTLNTASKSSRAGLFCRPVIQPGGLRQFDARGQRRCLPLSGFTPHRCQASPGAAEDAVQHCHQLPQGSILLWTPSYSSALESGGGYFYNNFGIGRLNAVISKLRLIYSILCLIPIIFLSSLPSPLKKKLLP